MNFLIIGDGPEEHAWAAFLAGCPEHRLVAAYPGLKPFPNLPGRQSLDDGLALAEMEAVIVGGDPELRAEALRRVAGGGWPVIALHPPGPNADPYYHVALSRQETGAVVVPDLPERRHPGVQMIAAAVAKGLAGDYRELRYELPIRNGGGSLVTVRFARAVDVIRAVIGEIEAVTATGDPPGIDPTLGLVVQLRGSADRRAEVRFTSGPEGTPSCLILSGSNGSIRFEHDLDTTGAPRLIRRIGGEESTTETPLFDPHRAVVIALDELRSGHPAHPDLLDGTRAMELAEAAERSLKRGRTIDLAYEEFSEEGSFKSVMTGMGCGLLVVAILILPVALAGPALGLNWTIYLAWLIPPALVVFALLQLLRFALSKKPRDTDPPVSTKPTDSQA